MAIRYKATIEEHKAVCLDYEGQFDLSIYKDEEEVYYHPTMLYSLKDASKIIRHHLGLKGKRITWEEDK